MPPQREIARSLLTPGSILSLAELRAASVTAATVSRMARDGEVIRLARGLYQHPDASLHLHHSMAEVAKRVPNGVVCLISALTFHGITLQLPSRVWLAIGQKDWAPKHDGVRIRISRFTENMLTQGAETHMIEGVPVKVFGVAKTVADCFRHRNKVGLSVALEGLREAIYQRKATPAEIGQQAITRGVWNVMQPYLEAILADG